MSTICRDRGGIGVWVLVHGATTVPRAGVKIDSVHVVDIESINELVVIDAVDHAALLRVITLAVRTGTHPTDYIVLVLLACQNVRRQVSQT